MEGEKTGMKNRESFWEEKKLSQCKERGKRWTQSNNARKESKEN